MTDEAPDRSARHNGLLAALPYAEYAALRPHLEEVPLALKQTLHEKDAPIRYIYFVTEGVCSLVGIMDDGTIVEVATVGNEGMVGVPVFLGAQSVSVEAMVQVPGAGLRLPADAFRAALGNGGRMRPIIGRYTQALMVQMSQSAVCNRLHAIRQRAARWLLMTHDRVSGDTFPLTQEFLGQMLGVGRPRVSEVEGALRDAGLIRYTRGQVTVVDREGLEAEACECYRIIRDEYDRLRG
jgi:CRP-like cAMP-binding protein